MTPIFHLVVKPSLSSIKPQQAQQQPSTSTIPQANNMSMPSTSSTNTSAAPVPEFNTSNNINTDYSHFAQFAANYNINNVPAYPSVLPGGYQVVVIK